MKQIPAHYILTAVFVLCLLLTGKAHASAGAVSTAAVPSLAQEQTPTDDGGPCAAAYLMGSDSDDLAALRTFRDEVLARTAMGQKLTELYYAKSSPLIALFESSPVLKRHARKSLEAVMPAVKTILTTKQ